LWEFEIGMVRNSVPTRVEQKFIKHSQEGHLTNKPIARRGASLNEWGKYNVCGNDS